MLFADDGFAEAFRQDPADDTLRLVYADALAERGDAASFARAELVRMQVELATLPPVTRRAAELVARQDELLAEWEADWLGEWADVLDGCTFRRGLVEAVRADASVFLDHAEEWFAEWPTLTVARLTRVAGHLGELAESPWLAHLRGLDLHDNGIDAPTLLQLRESQFLSLLEALDLSGNPIGAWGAGVVASLRTADELCELHLARCGLGDFGLDSLISGWRSRQWRRLDLADNDLRPDDIRRLCRSAAVRNLTALELAANPLGDAGAELLAATRATAALSDLGLNGIGLGDGGVTALARSSQLANLRDLDLRGHRCWPRYDRAGNPQSGIDELARSPLLGRLRRLLLGPSGASNNWAAEVMSVARPPRRLPLHEDWWMTQSLRSSPHLVPSQLEECDLAELWWLGDIDGRERPPAVFA